MTGSSKDSGCRVINLTKREMVQTSFPFALSPFEQTLEDMMKPQLGRVTTQGLEGSEEGWTRYKVQRT